MNRPSFTTKLGRVYYDDALNVLRSMEDKSVDLVLIDGPYFTNYKTNHRKDKDHEFCEEIDGDDETDVEEFDMVLKEIYRAMKHDTAFYCFCSPDKIDIVKPMILKYFNYKNSIVWVKNNWTAGDLEAQFGKQYENIIFVNKGRSKIKGKRLPDVWYADRISGNNQIHQNQKPVNLLIRAIESSTNIGDVVLDCYFGSGSTGVACERTGRRYVGVEKNKAKFEKMKDRLVGESKQGKLFY